MKVPSSTRIHVRRATPNDADVAATIIADALAEYGLPFDPNGRDADVQSFGAHEDHDDMIASIAGNVIGIVGVGPQGAPGIAWISKLFVQRNARGAGIGRMLLHAAQDVSRARGYVEVRLRTRVIFEAAMGLYRAEGYVSVTEAPDPANVVLSRFL